MICPHCRHSQVIELSRPTELGYRQYRCKGCQRQFNERTGSGLNFIMHLNEIVLLVVYHYQRFKLSLDDVVELMAIRGIDISHQTVHNWTQTFGPQIGNKLREIRRGSCGRKWHVDSGELRIAGRKCYFYRCFDRDDNLVDVMLSDTKDQEAAELFFRQCHDMASNEPIMITTDKEAALAIGIEEVFDDRVVHRKSRYMNNRLEQTHRAPKSRVKAMKGLKDEFSAVKFLVSFEELNELFRMKNKSRSARRKLIMSKFQEYCDLWKLAT